VVADVLGLTTVVWAVAALTVIPGLVVAIRMYETLPKPSRAVEGRAFLRIGAPTRPALIAFTNHDRVQAPGATRRRWPCAPHPYEFGFCCEVYGSRAGITAEETLW
jgi:hypothetical protein